MKILSVVPARISLFGGGTDISPFCDLYGGLCINLAINIRSKFTLFTGDDMYDPQANGQVPYLGKREFVYAFLNEFDLGDFHRCKFNSDFDGLLESGMGSSASSAVAIIGAINKLQNLGMSLSDIAEKAWDIEVNALNLFGGKQDQYCAAYGGFNIMKFYKDTVTVEPLETPFTYSKNLLSSLVLFYTGLNRKSAKIQEGFKKLSQYQIDNLTNLKNLALTAIDFIKKGDVEMVGELLNQTWEYKKHSNKGVSNPKIDKIYHHAIKHGALSGKILGAGGGGFMLFVVPDKKEEFIANMEKLDGIKHWDFSPDFTGLDIRILND